MKRKQQQLNKETVYNIAQALPDEEFIELAYMLLKDARKLIKNATERRKKAFELTVEDMTIYLIKNHFYKKKKM